MSRKEGCRKEPDMSKTILVNASTTVHKLQQLDGCSIAIVDDKDGFCLGVIDRDDLEEFL